MPFDMSIENGCVPNIFFSLISLFITYLRGLIKGLKLINLWISTWNNEECFNSNWVIMRCVVIDDTRWLCIKWKPCHILHDTYFFFVHSIESIIGWSAIMKLTDRKIERMKPSQMATHRTLSEDKVNEWYIFQ